MAANLFEDVRTRGKGAIPLGSCVFIPHKSEDKPMARAIASAIMEIGVNVYFDEHDAVLQEAARRGDEKAVASCIEDGLDKCSHLLGLITANSLKSWWIPYEIGGATGRRRECAHLVKKDVTSVPSFIKLSRVLIDRWDLEKWAGRLTGKSREMAKAAVQPPTSTRLERFLVSSRTSLNYY